MGWQPAADARFVASVSAAAAVGVLKLAVPPRLRRGCVRGLCVHALAPGRLLVVRPGVLCARLCAHPMRIGSRLRAGAMPLGGGPCPPLRLLCPRPPRNRTCLTCGGRSGATRPGDGAEHLQTAGLEAMGICKTASRYTQQVRGRSEVRSPTAAATTRPRRGVSARRLTPESRTCRRPRAPSS